MKIRKNTLYAVGIGVIIILAGFFAMSAQSDNVNSGVVSGDVQIVKMHVEGGNYVFSQSEFKKGQTVKIEADMNNMPGCSRSIVIPSFNIRKTLSNSDNVIEFTPDKAGTFNIACSMNMYQGTFTVLDDNGSKGNYVEPQNTAGGSCGGSDGGCGGCGGF